MKFFSRLWAKLPAPLKSLVRTTLRGAAQSAEPTLIAKVDTATHLPVGEILAAEIEARTSQNTPR